MGPGRGVAASTAEPTRAHTAANQPNGPLSKTDTGAHRHGHRHGHTDTGTQTRAHDDAPAGEGGLRPRLPDGRVLGGAASTTSGHQPVMKYSVLHAQPVS